MCMHTQVDSAVPFHTVLIIKDVEIKDIIDKDMNYTPRSVRIPSLMLLLKTAHLGVPEFLP